MSSRKKYAIDLISSIVGDVPTAEMVVERLNDEGLLHLGYGDAEVDQVLEAFKEANGTTKVTKYDRFAASRMVKEYTGKAVVQIVKMLAQSNGKYKPVVNNIQQLEDKWVSVVNYLRSEHQDSSDIIDA